MTKKNHIDAVNEIGSLVSQAIPSHIAQSQMTFSMHMVEFIL